MTVEVKLDVPDDVLAYLQHEAERRNVGLDQIVSDVVSDYFDDPTHEELLSGLKRSIEQVLAGDYRPAREFLDELDAETGHNADQG